MAFAGVLVIVYGAGFVLLAWLVLVVGAWRGKHHLERVWLEPAVMVLMLAAVDSGVLFRMRFLASRSSLDRYVARAVAAGASHRKSSNVGFFVARETQVFSNGVVRIITTSCALDDCGIAFSRGTPPVIGEDEYEHLHGNWWRWKRSW